MGQKMQNKKLRLFIDYSDYGTQRFFVFYLIDENNKIVHANWSKQFSTNDVIERVSTLEKFPLSAQKP